MNAARINRNIGGFFMGGTALIADLLRLGVAGGYSNSSFNVNDRFSTGSSDNYHVRLMGALAGTPSACVLAVVIPGMTSKRTAISFFRVSTTR